MPMLAEMTTTRVTTRSSGDEAPTKISPFWDKFLRMYSCAVDEKGESGCGKLMKENPWHSPPPPYSLFGLIDIVGLFDFRERNMARNAALLDILDIPSIPKTPGMTHLLCSHTHSILGH